MTGKVHRHSGDFTEVFRGKIFTVTPCSFYIHSVLAAGVAFAAACALLLFRL